MEYYINPQSLTSVFTVQTSVVDRYLKLAKGEHIKVLLYIMKNMSVNPSVEEIKSATDVSEYDIKEALLYWADAGILLPINQQDKSETNNSENKAPAISKIIKPDRNDVAKRGSEDSKIRYLLQEAQMKLGRNLKSNEASTLVWLYDDQGLDISVILLIVEYSISRKKANIRFIESLAIDWINRGIDNITAADEELRKSAMKLEAWNVAESAFGIESRRPSKKEAELALLWLNEWKFSKEMLTTAYDICVNNKSKFSIPYIAKVLEDWHKKGFTKPEDINKESKKNEPVNYKSYDIDLFEKMLNSKD